MAFAAADLTLQSPGGADVRLWTYNSTDVIATIVASGYFNDATDELRQSDMIAVAGDTGGTPTFDLIGVTSATGAATVTTTNGT